MKDTKTLICCFLAATAALLFVVTPSVAQDRYEANWKSLDSRPTPKWYTDAKFGIFIHWGIYSVPAWGTEKAYSEWYWRRTFKDDGSLQDNEWAKFHKQNYGEDFQYHAFAPMFKCELFDPDEWADIFARSGAKYVVLTSKHHDGFCLWPSKDANRTWGRLWNSVDTGPKRDLLGDLTQSVRQSGLKMGFYKLMESIGKPKGGKAVIEAFFTSKPGVLYATTPGWPGKKLLLRNVSPARNAVVKMLGVDRTLPWRAEGTTMTIDVSQITADMLPCQWAYTFKIPVRR